MGRHKRIEFPGAFYHVCARGNNKQKIFHDTQDYTVYLERIKRYSERYRFILYAYVLMSNHIHLAIETCKIPLSKIMQGIQQSYSYYARKKYSYVGHLYQAPYIAILYEKEEFILSIVRYIHRNPVEARLVESPEQYPWSSHRIYQNLSDCSFLNKKTVLEMFSHNETRSIQMFNDFVEQGLSILEQMNFDNAKDRQIVGNKEFVKKIKAEDENESTNIKAQKNNKFSLTRKKTLSEILKIVSKQTKVSADAILSRSRRQDIVQARRFFAFISAKYNGYLLVDIARYLKQDASSITKMLHRMEDELKTNPDLTDKVLKVIQVRKAWSQNED